MADDRTANPPTALQTAATGLVDRARTGRLLSPRAARVLGITLVVLLGAGVWWYLARESRRAASRSWADYTQPGVDLPDYAAKNKDTAAGRVARLEQARQLFGPDGVATLNVADRDRRNKGIDNIAAARDEFVKLAAEFAGSKTLAATCFAQAAEAELSLVGIPKDTTSAAGRGTVDAAADYLEKAAKAAGDRTAAGEKLLARAVDLKARAADIVAAAQALNAPYNRPVEFTAPTPGGPTGPTGVNLTPSTPPAPPAAPVKGVDLPATPPSAKK